MLKKRIIFTLHYDKGFFNLSRNFRLQKIGDLNWLLKNYNFLKIAESIDELIIIDVSRDNREHDKFLENVSEITKNIFVPVCLGGGIRTLEYAKKLFESGADKINLNTSLFHDPSLVDEISKTYGAQAIIGHIDFRKKENDYYVFTNNGAKEFSKIDTAFMEKILELNFGELLLHSMDKDGTGMNFDYEIMKYLPQNNKKPLIFSGGAGNYHHLKEGLAHKDIDAVSTANLLNFVGDGLINARKVMLDEKYPLAKWE